MNRHDLVVKRHIGVGQIGYDEVEVQWVVDTVVDVQGQQVNPVRAGCRRVGMNEGDDDGFRGLTFHGEIRFRAADVPRHGLTGLDMEHLAGLHGGVGRDEGRVGQGNVPGRRRDGAGTQCLDRGGSLEFDTRGRDVDLNVQTVVVLSNFLHVVIWVNDEGEGARSCGLGRPRPHEHFGRPCSEFNRPPRQFRTVHLKCNREGLGFDVSKVEERGRQLNRIVDLWNGDVHLEVLGHHLRVRAEVVHTMTEHGDGVGLCFRPAVLGVLDLHRPGPLSGVIDEHDFEVVDAVPRSTGGRPAVGEIVAEVDRPVGCRDFQIQIVHELCIGKPRTTLVRPGQDGLEHPRGLRDVERIRLAVARARHYRAVVHPDALTTRRCEAVAQVDAAPTFVVVRDVARTHVLSAKHEQGLDQRTLR